jgi:hypothetical protein
LRGNRWRLRRKVRIERKQLESKKESEYREETI